MSQQHEILQLVTLAVLFTRFFIFTFISQQLLHYDNRVISKKLS
jgi:hypothetical protein